MPLLLPADQAGIARAAEILRQGGLVAFPTETVYGLGARADDATAVERIYRAKGRPATNPSIVHVATRTAAERVGAFGAATRALAEAFWPGPLTLVVDRSPGMVVDAVCAGGTTVALRIPDHPVALALLAAVALPVAAPSANRSTHVSPTTVAHVLRSLGEAPDAILDGGATDRGIESTIVDARAEIEAILLRAGALSAAAIAAAIAPRTLVDRSTRVDGAAAAAAAPGSQARHYAPEGTLVVVARSEVGPAIARARAAGSARVGSISVGPSAAAAAADASAVLPADPIGYARQLYAALHDLEAAGCTALVIERTPADEDWAAVRDRLRRASVV